MKNLDWQRLADIDGIISHLENLCVEFDAVAIEERDFETAIRISFYTPQIRTAIETLREMQEYCYSLQ